MALTRTQIDLHRWADDGGLAERPVTERIEKIKRDAHRRHHLKARTQLDAIREKAGRHAGYAHRGLEVSR